jgi:hypothetical protein
MKETYSSTLYTRELVSMAKPLILASCFLQKLFKQNGSNDMWLKDNNDPYLPCYIICMSRASFLVFLPYTMVHFCPFFPFFLHVFVFIYSYFHSVFFLSFSLLGIQSNFYFPCYSLFRCICIPTKRVR